MTLTRRGALRRLAAGGAASLGLPGLARAQAATHTLRIGVAQPAVGQPPSIAGSSMAIAHAKGWIDEAFQPDGVKVEWLFFKGAGPAVNEALTTGQLDFAFQGDLPAIVARSAGLKTRLILATGVRSNIYIGVPPDSRPRTPRAGLRPARPPRGSRKLGAARRFLEKTVADLRGKRVSLFRGTNMHLPALRLLEAHGLAEKDLKILNLDTAGYLTALATRDIDAAIGAMDILRLRDKGQVRVLYASKGDSPVFTRQSHVLVTDAYAAAHPQHVQRLVDAAVRTARWSSDEANREEVLRLWARAGTPYEHWKEDYAGEPLRVRLNPNFDPFLVARYKDAEAQAYRFKLSRKRFDVDGWIDTRYLQASLRQQGLQNYWPVYQADGKALGA
ncbi:ABC transporter substrate-binding protein [Aquincola tertiaricarbonis]|uniref:ABC transporter substrate-binding protein n=1 Tax=Aquincola tertiaricarbonis TaxID=391953 RepID=A0ABY4S2E7_AQUTE|nr:ABC transporter substrate-binding protein [Aquincola tertiaricarbonis]URI06137.1 ABC transporter substrate-binding protein [Aquincola tertiaricarbonis]